MRKVIVSEWMSLDGVVQAPAYADEDTSADDRSRHPWRRLALLRDDGACRRLALVTSETTPTGAILVRYARATADAPVGPSAVPLPRPPHDRRR